MIQELRNLEEIMTQASPSFGKIQDLAVTMIQL